MRLLYLPTEGAWSEFPRLVERLIKENKTRQVCDVGGGANPVLTIDQLQNNQVECTILDISNEELEKAPAGYRRLQQDIEARDFPLHECFDLVVTQMLAEHIHDGKVFHKNVYYLLKPGGIAVHFLPTLYSLPFVANKLIPERISSTLIDLFAPRERYQQGKFPAYYSWCYGPTWPMLRMLRTIGFEIVEFRGLMGHSYFDRVPVIREFHRSLSRFMVMHPSPYLTSFAQVILRRPLGI